MSFSVAQPNLYQWIGRMNCTSDEYGVAETGEVFIISRPTEKELNRHLIVAVTSFLHEAQHLATNELLNPVLACCGDSGHKPNATDASGCISPAPDQACRQMRVGTTEFQGQKSGVPGFATEEIIFGGRLMHLEKRLLPPYLVWFLPVACPWNIQFLTCRFCSDGTCRCTSEGS